MIMKSKRKSYICMTDYQHGLGECAIKVYPTIKSLKKACLCWKECGIVELEIRVKKIIERPPLSKGVIKRS
jgi:hypothetical protein